MQKRWEDWVEKRKLNKPPVPKEDEAVDDESVLKEVVPYDANEIIEEMSEESSFYLNSPSKYRKSPFKHKRSPNKVLPMKPYLKQLLADVIN